MERGIFTLHWRQEKRVTEGEVAGWYHWQWTRIWASSGRQWRTGKPGVLQSMGSQWVRHGNWTGNTAGVKGISGRSHCASGHGQGRAVAIAKTAQPPYSLRDLGPVPLPRWVSDSSSVTCHWKPLLPRGLGKFLLGWFLASSPWRLSQEGTCLCSTPSLPSLFKTSLILLNILQGWHDYPHFADEKG